MQFKLDMRSKAARSAFANAPKLFNRYIKGGFQNIGDEFSLATKQRINRPWSQINKTNRLSSRSRDLVNSVKAHKVTGFADTLRLRVTIGDSDTAKYVWTHEGGPNGTPVTIRPKKARGFLTVPLPDNMTAGGRVRYPSARALMGTGRTYRKGRAIFLRTGLHQTDNDPALWALVKKVTIKPRLKFRDTWLNSTKIDKMRRRLLREAVADAVAAIEGGAS